MGISGLLPALKSIQFTKHLSEFSGQVVAVDGYVWLHKGVFTCATELATGKPTNKYVNYGMEKVRLLRHHGIEPYLVFDGGPLPAKKGTEVERKRKREESLARGNLLASQGKHAQARDCYLKCVDVTPQMAFQFIKALRAENVQYVVAPYEADAQLAYLERKKIVSAILTEDSDLLVFGCQHVLLKLDTVARTVVSISRSDFGAVTTTASEPNSISLVGWSDHQFRAMAILSGCDYLPSIPGVGLKTAYTMLRKCKTPEVVVRSLAFEGKRNVPKGYMDNFRLAEKCFLHQRVYDPSLGKLVHLNDVDLQQWDDVADTYVGSDIDPELAMKIALGDADPITYEPMNDINPGFTPRSRVLQDIPLSAATSSINKSKGKGKARETPVTAGILSFFGPNPTIPPRSRSPSASRRPIAVKTTIAGKASGKRTLAEVMDHDLSVKKKQRQQEHSASNTKQTLSKFFGKVTSPSAPSTPSTQAIHSKEPVAGPSHLGADKENEHIAIESDGEDLMSCVPQGYLDSDRDLVVNAEEDPVQQEDGYISPSPSRFRDTDELSSPPRPGFSFSQHKDAYEFDILSSPPSAAPATRYIDGMPPSLRTPRSKSLDTVSTGKILVHASPEPEDVFAEKQVVQVDLRHCFKDNLRTEIEYSGDVSSTPSPSPSPLTPDDEPGMMRQEIAVVEGDGDLEIDDPEEEELRANVRRTVAVAAGWRQRWALGPGHALPKPRSSKESPALKRSETNVTPVGRHRFGVNVLSRDPHTVNSNLKPPDSAPAKVPTGLKQSVGLKSRRSLVFFEEVMTGRGL